MAKSKKYELLPARQLPIFERPPPPPTADPALLYELATLLELYVELEPCPACEAEEGHESGCRIAAALRRTEAQGWVASTEL